MSTVVCKHFEGFFGVALVRVHDNMMDPPTLEALTCCEAPSPCKRPSVEETLYCMPMGGCGNPCLWLVFLIFMETLKWCKRQCEKYFGMYDVRRDTLASFTTMHFTRNDALWLEHMNLNTRLRVEKS